MVNVSGTGAMAIGGSLTVFNLPGNAVNFSNGTISSPALNFNGNPALFNWTGGLLDITSSVAWDSAAAPNSTSAVFGSSLTLNSGQGLEVDGDETLGAVGGFGLTLNVNSSHFVTGTLTIAPNGSITQNLGSSLYASTILQTGGTVEGYLQNQAIFTYESGAFHGRLINNGQVSFGTLFQAGNGIQNNFELIVNAGQTLISDGAGLDNVGTLILNGGVLSGSGPLMNEPGASMSAYGSINSQVVNRSTINIADAQSLQFVGNVSGGGNYTGTGTALYLATFAPGTSSANVTYEGHATFASSAVLQLEVAGTTPDKFDHLQVGGTLSLGGTLQLLLTNGFIPVTGDTFDILSWGNRIGEFDALDLPTLNGRIVWDSSQLYTTGVLTVLNTYLAGDINRDGRVTMADVSALITALTDLQAYQSSHPGMTDPTLFLDVADVNGDAHVNNADIQALISFLASNNGRIGGGQLTAVPEPATLTLCVIGLSVLAMRRFRSHGSINVHNFQSDFFINPLAGARF